MNLTKLESARRQLDTAIELYFADRDPVSVHALAAAAFEVLTALRDRAGHPDEVFDLVVPERRKEVLRMWRAAQNFLKHADRDPDATLELDPEFTDVVLVLAARRYAALAEMTLAMRVMQSWFLLRHPDLLIDSSVRSKVEELAARSAHLDRRTFWKNMHLAAADLALGT